MSEAHGKSSRQKLRVAGFAVSLDGYGAGPNQDLRNPLGVRGTELMQWVFPTLAFRQMHGQHGGETGTDNAMTEKATDGIGAWILGRNMFGPIRGPWRDDEWKGWWGEEPPYRMPVFVLTHHKRASFKMKGGTEFHFVTDGIQAALDQAMAAAGGLDVRLGGGVSTVRQYLRARLVDELQLAVSPVVLGSGESLWNGLNMNILGYECEKQVAGERATHVFLRRAGIAPA